LNREALGCSGGLDEERCRWFYQQLILAMDYCHKKGISNRDIKLENTLLDSPEMKNRKPLLKICDFGYSINEEKSDAKTVCGTPGYAGTVPHTSRLQQNLFG
jgi:serine/threonine-protein kinase SRK2